MDNDDAQVGRLLSRREAIAFLGAAGIAAIVGCGDDVVEVVPGATGTAAGASGSGGSSAATVAATAASTSASAASGAATPAVVQCVVRPEQTEGPYFVDEGLNRSDIRSDPASGALSDGVPLDLTFRVMRMNASACEPLAGAMVDIWQCDALGVYSDVRDTAAGNFNSVGKQFLRGFQVTDNLGAAKFTTIYPGWYQGRTVHIHFKVRARDSAGKAQEFTSQLYFDDALSDQVFALAPYSQKGRRSTLNTNDGIFGNGGSQLLLAPVKTAAGYDASFALGLQIT
ncbi:MAG: intradiol ring-cleavage dioxygenase [Dehalococcoidia bacterium]|nr:intradiol ring-cleavage dioxygenase [Dehalococcoidia bacterium]